MKWWHLEIFHIVSLQWLLTRERNGFIGGLKCPDPPSLYLYIGKGYKSLGWSWITNDSFNQVCPNEGLRKNPIGKLRSIPGCLTERQSLSSFNLQCHRWGTQDTRPPQRITGWQIAPKPSHIKLHHSACDQLWNQEPGPYGMKIQMLGKYFLVPPLAAACARQRVWKNRNKPMSMQALLHSKGMFSIPFKIKVSCK